MIDHDERSLITSVFSSLQCIVQSIDLCRYSFRMKNDQCRTCNCKIRKVVSADSHSKLFKMVYNNLKQNYNNQTFYLPKISEIGDIVRLGTLKIYILQIEMIVKFPGKMKNCFGSFCKNKRAVSQTKLTEDSFQ